MSTVDDDHSTGTDTDTSTGTSTADATRTATAPHGASSTMAGPAAEPPARPRIRSNTVVWGLVLAAIGVGLLAAAAGLEFDVQLALIVLIGLAGVALLVSSLTSARRRR